MPDLSGRYWINNKIGKGGFGAVCLGFDDRLDRRMAIKVAGGRRQEQDETYFFEQRNTLRG